MADNFPTNPGSGGNTFAADDVGGVLYPRVKLTHGPDGAAQDASDAAPLPVEDSAAASALAAILAKLIATPATAAGQADQLTALSTLLAQTDGIEGSLASILAKLTSDPSTAALQTAANALLTTIRDRTPALNGTLTDRSGTIAAGGTAQQAMAANASRQGFSIQNLSTTADLWINSLGTASASQPSIKLAPGAYFETPARYGALGALSVFSATTGVAYTAREW
jgi:hypothetical protein